MTRALVRAPRAPLARPLPPRPAPPRVIVVEVQRVPRAPVDSRASVHASDSATLLPLLDVVLKGLIVFLGAVLYLCMEHGSPMRKNNH